MTGIFGVPGALIDSVWVEVEPFITRCVEKIKEYRWDAEDIRDRIRTNDAQLWLCLDEKKLLGVLVTELVRCPKAFECNLFMAAGELPEDWREHLACIEQWARDIGCTHMASVARPGSARKVGYDKGLIRTSRRL